MNGLNFRPFNISDSESHAIFILAMKETTRNRANCTGQHIVLFICGLFNGAATSSDYRPLGRRMMV
jgi:hypothetical protein